MIQRSHRIKRSLRNSLLTGAILNYVLNNLWAKVWWEDMGRKKLVFDCLMFSRCKSEIFLGKRQEKQKNVGKDLKFIDRFPWPFLDKRTCVFIDVSGPVSNVLADLLGQSVDNLKRQQGDIEIKESKLILTFLRFPNFFDSCHGLHAIFLVAPAYDSQMIYVWKCLPDPGLEFLKVSTGPDGCEFGDIRLPPTLWSFGTQIHTKVSIFGAIRFDQHDQSLDPVNSWVHRLYHQKHCLEILDMIQYSSHKLTGECPLRYFVLGGTVICRYERNKEYFNKLPPKVFFRSCCCPMHRRRWTSTLAAINDSILFLVFQWIHEWALTSAKTRRIWAKEKGEKTGLISKRE